MPESAAAIGVPKLSPMSIPVCVWSVGQLGS